MCSTVYFIQVYEHEQTSVCITRSKDYSQGWPGEPSQQPGWFNTVFTLKSIDNEQCGSCRLSSCACPSERTIETLHLLNKLVFNLLNPSIRIVEKAFQQTFPHNNIKLNTSIEPWGTPFNHVGFKWLNVQGRPQLGIQSPTLYRSWDSGTGFIFVNLFFFFFFYSRCIIRRFVCAHSNVWIKTIKGWGHIPVLNVYSYPQPPLLGLG